MGKTEGLSDLLLGDEEPRKADYEWKYRNVGAFGGNPDLKEKILDRLIHLNRTRLAAISLIGAVCGKPRQNENDADFYQRHIGLPLWTLGVLLDGPDPKLNLEKVWRAVPAGARLNPESVSGLVSNSRIYDLALTADENKNKVIYGENLEQAILFYEGGGDETHRRSLLGRLNPKEPIDRIIKDTLEGNQRGAAKRNREFYRLYLPHETPDETENIIAATNWLVDGDVDENGIYTG